jgi:MYXO-CTERM domain-containing protein
MIPSTRRFTLLSATVISALWGSPAAAAPLERQPYLQRSTPQEITIVWTTEGSSTGAVEYGSDPTNLDQSVASGSTASQHAVRITGLQPDTRYYYRVISDDTPVAGGDEQHYFVTPPTAGTRSKFRAWVVGDSGTGGSMQASVRDAMLVNVGLHRPDIYLHMGDMAYSSGTYSEFTDKFYAPYEGILRNTCVWPTIGNHEGSSSDSQSESGPYYDGYVLPIAGEAGGLASGTEAYYSFDWANVHFLVLDSHDTPRDPDGAMLQWAEQDLAGTDQEWIVAFWHHPPYTKGSHDSDNEGQLIDMRENALPILEAAGVDLVLGGHSHIYERSYLLDGAYSTPSMPGEGVIDSGDGMPTGDGPYVKPAGLSSNQGAVYVVAGHGGTGVSQKGIHPLMFVTELANGSCLLDVQENRLTVKNVRFDGVITDRVDIVKGEAIVIATPDGGETLAAGQPYDITWATAGEVAQVDLDYSIDDGATWTAIEAGVANTGTYSWVPPAVDTAAGLVRVTASDDAQIRDESNAGFIMSGTAPVVVVDFGSQWSYHDQGMDLGDGWAEPGFDDATWPTGDAQFGYGDGDEATELVDADPNHPSAYFRTTFQLDGDPVGAELQALYDDGVVVWINGQQVWAVNADDTSYAAYASASSDDNATATARIPADALVRGENVLAAMAKQAGEGSSDLSFDLKLTVTVMFDPPPGGDGSGTGADGTAGGGDAGGDADSTVGDAGGPGGSAGTSAGTGGLPTTGDPGAADGGPGSCACRSRPGPTSGLAWIAIVLLAGRRRRG